LNCKALLSDFEKSDFRKIFIKNCIMILI